MKTRREVLQSLIVSIGGEVMGKLGKQGEVLDLIDISTDYFSD